MGPPPDQFRLFAGQIAVHNFLAHRHQQIGLSPLITSSRSRSSNAEHQPVWAEAKSVERRSAGRGPDDLQDQGILRADLVQAKVLALRPRPELNIYSISCPGPDHRQKQRSLM